MNIILFLCAVLLVTARLGQAQTYIAEISIFVNEEVSRRYEREFSNNRARAEEELRKDIDYTLTEANKLLETLQGINFQARVRSLNLKENIFDRGFLSPTSIDGRTALLTAQDWLEEGGYYDQLNYDAAIVYTGFDVVGSSRYFQGYSYIGEGCEPSTALGIVEFNATYATAVYTAKYIARIFGAGEDGIAEAYVCRRYTYPEQKQRWTFSPCSSDAMQAYFDTLSTNCLLTTSPESTTPNVSPASYTGRMFDPDVICQRSLNDDRTYMAKFGNFYGDQEPGGDNVCQKIYCWIPGTTKYDTVFPSEGMLCDGSQRCDNGVCGSGVSSTDTCVFGDQKEIFFPSSDFQGTCEEYIDLKPFACYYSDNRASCCETCARRRGSDDCPWGDKYPAWCRKYSPEQICPDVDCCETCSGFRGKRSADGPQPEPFNITVDFVEEFSEHTVYHRVIHVEE